MNVSENIALAGVITAIIIPLLVASKAIVESAKRYVLNSNRLNNLSISTSSIQNVDFSQEETDDVIRTIQKYFALSTALIVFEIVFQRYRIIYVPYIITLGFYLYFYTKLDKKYTTHNRPHCDYEKIFFPVILISCYLYNFYIEHYATFPSIALLLVCVSMCIYIPIIRIHRFDVNNLDNIFIFSLKSIILLILSILYINTISLYQINLTFSIILSIILLLYVGIILIPQVLLKTILFVKY